jgi:hypothetical protein
LSSPRPSWRWLADVTRVPRETREVVVDAMPVSMVPDVFAESLLLEERPLRCELPFATACGADVVAALPHVLQKPSSYSPGQLVSLHLGPEVAPAS